MKSFPLVRLILMAVVFAVSGVRAQIVYVSLYGANTIAKITLGSGTTNFVTTGLLYPKGLALDTSGNLYVANEGSGTSGGYVSKVTPAGSASTYVSGLNRPTGLAFDASGNLYVSSSNSAGIKLVPPGGGSFSAYSNVGGDIEQLAFDASGNLYAADYSNHLILQVAGNTTTTYATLSNGNPMGLAFDSSGVLYASVLSSNVIDKIAVNQTVTLNFATGMSAPYYLSSDGINLYVADNYNSNVYEVLPNGTKVLLANYNYNLPHGIAYSAVPESAEWVLGAGWGALVFATWRGRRRRTG